MSDMSESHPTPEGRSAAASAPSPDVVRVLSHAESLARQGRLTEAIAYLSDENRAEPTALYEYRLCRLRHAAFDPKGSSIKPGPWPPAVRDMFPDCTIPEITLDQLNGESLASGILHHGSLLVRGLIPVDDAHKLAQGIDHAFEAAAAAKAGDPPSRTLPWYAPMRAAYQNEQLARARLMTRRGGGVLTADSPRMVFDLLELLERRRVLDSIRDFLGETPTLSAQKATLRRVEYATHVDPDWHQDGSFLGADVKAVNVWLTLSDCGVDAPGLDVVARRLPEIVETGTEGAKFDWSVGRPIVEAAAGDGGIESPVMGPGDGMLFDQLCLHRTGSRPGMSRVRYAIESWFFAPSKGPKRYFPLVV